MFTVYRIYSNLYFTVGLQYQATWRSLCLGLRIRHVSRGEGEFFVPQNPLILRDHVPSFWGWLPPVLRPDCLRFLRSAYLWFLLRPLASCPRPVCLRFSRSLYLRLGFSYLQPQRAWELLLKYLCILIYNSHSSKTVEHCYSYSSSLLYNCCITITTTLHIVTYYSLHSCIYNNNSRSSYT